MGINYISDVKLYGVDLDITQLLCPVGQIYPWFSSVLPDEEFWHFADGSSFDPLEYPKLHEVYPDDKFPLRNELAPTCIGKNTTYVFDDTENPDPDDPETFGTQAHDIFEIGEFKDDQFQGHEHKYNARERIKQSDESMFAQEHQVRNIEQRTTASTVSHDTESTPRYGTVTRGKRMGCNFIVRIK